AAASARAPHVIVVGAGPAGLSAALALAEKGVLVTLVESAGQVGGKAKGWTEDVAGVPVDVENGVHHVDAGYVHLQDLVERYALGDALRPGRTERLAVCTDGQRVPVPSIKKVARERLAGLGVAWSSARRAARDLAALPPLMVRQRYGGQAGTGLPSTPLSAYAESLSRLRFWAAPADVDAATLADAERTAQLPLTWIAGNPQALLWEPLASAFRSQRGKLRLRHRVEGLIVEDGRAVGVTLGEPLRSWVVAPPSGRGWEPLEAEEPLFVRVGPTGIEAIHGRCTHAGCSVGLDESGFACPCHGGQYDAEGRNVAGPPPAPLERARVEPEGGAIRVSLGGTLEELRGDAVVLAVDARSFGRIAGAVLPEAAGLRTTTHVVARFWFDRDVPLGLPDAEVVEGTRYVTAAVFVHRLQDAAGKWSDATGGCVLEVRAGRPLPPAMTNRAVLDLLETDIRVVYPELLEANVVKRTLARGDDFTWFQPGWQASAAPVVTGLPGLYAAGDHVRADLTGQLLERAVATGRLAASAVLESLGAEPLPPV
ncbi:MAG: FAD-dependent oxidoreductase, partial [Myxococcales bacterium]|nr:FAD-dependent oxidoreductase [Myxococcales bacterium]